MDNTPQKPRWLPKQISHRIEGSAENRKHWPAVPRPAGLVQKPEVEETLIFGVRRQSEVSTALCELLSRRRFQWMIRSVNCEPFRAIRVKWQSGVALRLPPHSKATKKGQAIAWPFCFKERRLIVASPHKSEQQVKNRDKNVE